MTPDEWEEFLRLNSEIEKSEGERILREIQNVRTSLHIVTTNYQELLQLLQALQKPELIPELIGNVPGRGKLRLPAFEEISRRLFNFLAAAFSLVDHTRRHRRKLYGTSSFGREVDDEINRRFALNSDHLIAQGLRNYALHVTILPQSIVVTFGEKMSTPNTAFNLHVESLLAWDGWTTQQRKAIQGLGENLELGPYTSRYFDLINSFYEWLWKRQSIVHQADIEATNRLRDRARELYLIDMQEVDKAAGDLNAENSDT